MDRADAFFITLVVFGLMSLSLINSCQGDQLSERIGFLESGLSRNAPIIVTADDGIQFEIHMTGGITMESEDTGVQYLEVRKIYYKEKEGK